MLIYYKEDVLWIFSYYQELDTIWNGVPSFDSELVSSKPKGNHMESLLRIVTPKAGGVPLGSSAGGSSAALEEDYELVEDKIEEVATMETGETQQCYSIGGPLSFFFPTQDPLVHLEETGMISH